jgi:hypothetical protein
MAEDLAVRDAMRAAVSVRRAWLVPGQKGASNQIYLEVAIDRPPVDVAFIAEVRAKDEKYGEQAGRVHCRAGQAVGPIRLRYFFNEDWAAADMAPLELTLRLDPDAPLDLTTIWDGKVTVDGVRVDEKNPEP